MPDLCTLPAAEPGEEDDWPSAFAREHEARFGYTRHNGSQVVLNADEGVAFARQNGIAVYPFPAQTFPQILFSYSGLDLNSRPIMSGT